MNAERFLVYMSLFMLVFIFLLTVVLHLPPEMFGMY